MIEIKKSDFFETGKDGVKKILTPNDKKIDIIEFDDKKLCYVKSAQDAFIPAPNLKKFLRIVKKRE